MRGLLLLCKPIKHFDHCNCNITQDTTTSNQSNIVGMLECIDIKVCCVLLVLCSDIVPIIFYAYPFYVYVSDLCFISNSLCLAFAEFLCSQKPNAQIYKYQGIAAYLAKPINFHVYYRVRFMPFTL